MNQNSRKHPFTQKHLIDIYCIPGLVLKEREKGVTAFSPHNDHPLFFSAREEIGAQRG